ncbi:MAG TPA: hypothetical protein VJ124_00540, partial [Pyrinomonadaceae bacterium]|nr:hypothetical protein [Pyrinomonadaceae bacterium]
AYCAEAGPAASEEAVVRTFNVASARPADQVVLGQAPFCCMTWDTLPVVILNLSPSPPEI